MSSHRYQGHHRRPRAQTVTLPRTVAAVTAAGVAAVPLMTMTGGPASAATNNHVKITRVVNVTRAQAPSAAQASAARVAHLAHTARQREISHEAHVRHENHLAHLAAEAGTTQTWDAQPVRVTETSTSTADSAALAWAYTQVGWDYVWGGTGPASGGYDCSGLVQAAYASQGIQLPRTTYDMVNSPHLHPISADQLQPGDLVFAYADDHVEIYTGTPFVTLGAHSPGHGVSTVSWYGWPSDAGFYSVS